MTDTAIFYDLETSDQNFIGQILNFSFIAVDKNWKVIDECNGEVLINRLQLPSPGAILANRIDVLKHQQTAELNEKNAGLKIAQFIDKQTNATGKASLIGYNSSKFDLPFLRTTLIRNGINPYFYGKIIYKDLLHLGRRLSVYEKNFPRKEGKTPGRISFSLETLTTEFGLLKGKQAHSSREDVLLTIELAKYLKNKFKIDIREFEAYEASGLHKSCGKGTVYKQRFPLYDAAVKDGFYTEAYSTLLNCDHRYSLWIDLERYKEGLGRKSISWYSQQTSSFFTEGEEVMEAEYMSLAKEALKEFKDINLRNYFEKSECDIEQDIYRLDISMINCLSDVIWQGNRNDSKSKLSKEAKVVHLRHELANYEWGGKNDQQVKEKLKQYATYRYGGPILLNKFKDDEGSDYSPKKHPGLAELISVSESPACNSNDEDASLMRSLREFYKKSDLYTLL